MSTLEWFLVVSVPAARGSDFADPARRRQRDRWLSGHLPAGPAPLLVALHEDGLTQRLSSLGLAACRPARSEDPRP